MLLGVDTVKLSNLNMQKQRRNSKGRSILSNKMLMQIKVKQQHRTLKVNQHYFGLIKIVDRGPVKMHSNIQGADLNKKL